jgi:hypothetical protein
VSDPHTQAALQYLIQQSQGLLEGDQSRDWKTEPIPFRQFISEHFKITLTDRQMQDSIMLLGEDPKKTFDGGSPHSTFVLVASKGSGKDFLAAVIILYCFYLLLCMEDPRKFLKFNNVELPITESIDMLVISYTEEQAREVSFGKLRELVRHWVWLKQHFTVVEGDKIITSHRDKPMVTILSDQIKTWNNIKIAAQHSMNESFEGYNPLVWAMSEASAFQTRAKSRNGQKVYNTLRTSSGSRFGDRWKGMVYSYLRDDELTDFTWKLYEEAAKSPSMWRDLVFAWDFNPRLMNQPTFTFECDVEVKDADGNIQTEHRVYKVPIVPYQEEAERDREFFKKAVLCLIPKVGEQAAPAALIASAIHKFHPIVTFKNRVEPNLEGKLEIVVDLLDLEENKGLFVWDYLISVDLGEKHAATGFSIAHKEPGKGFVQDAIISWTPIEKDEANPIAAWVNMDDVLQKLKTLAKALNNARVAFDQWQSSLYMSELTADGIKCEVYHTHQARTYRIFRRAMGARMAWLVNDLELLRQWNALILDQNEVKLNTKISRRKDLVDATVGGYMILMKDYQPAPLGVPGAEMIGNNLFQQGGYLIPDS